MDLWPGGKYAKDLEPFKINRLTTLKEIDTYYLPENTVPYKYPTPFFMPTDELYWTNTKEALDKQWILFTSKTGITPQEQRRMNVINTDVAQAAPPLAPPIVPPAIEPAIISDARLVFVDPSKFEPYRTKYNAEMQQYFHHFGYYAQQEADQKYYLHKSGARTSTIGAVREIVDYYDTNGKKLPPKKALEFKPYIAPKPPTPPPPPKSLDEQLIDDARAGKPDFKTKHPDFDQYFAGLGIVNKESSIDGSFEYYLGSHKISEQQAVTKIVQYYDKNKKLPKKAPLTVIRSAPATPAKPPSPKTASPPSTPFKTPTVTPTKPSTPLPPATPSNSSTPPASSTPLGTSTPPSQKLQEEYNQYFTNNKQKVISELVHHAKQLGWMITVPYDKVTEAIDHQIQRFQQQFDGITDFERDKPTLFDLSTRIEILKQYKQHLAGEQAKQEAERKAKEEEAKRQAEASALQQQQAYEAEQERKRQERQAELDFLDAIEAVKHGIFEMLTEDHDGKTLDEIIPIVEQMHADEQDRIRKEAMRQMIQELKDQSEKDKQKHREKLVSSDDQDESEKKQGSASQLLYDEAVFVQYVSNLSAKSSSTGFPLFIRRYEQKHGKGSFAPAFKTTVIEGTHGEIDVKINDKGASRFYLNGKHVAFDKVQARLEQLLPI